MAERISHRLTTLLLSGVCVLLCIAYLCLTTRELIAAHAAHEGVISGLQRSVRVSPANAAYHAEYGRALLFSGDWNDARAQLETATRLNPNEPEYWLDLSRVHQIAGNTIQASLAADQALAMGGSYSWVLWEAGLLYLGQNEQGKALGVFRRALQSETLPPDRVIDICWRTTRNPEFILDSLMTGKAQPYSELLRVLIRDGEAGAVDKVWQHLLQARNSLPPDVSFGYLDFLVKQRRIGDAVRAWRAFAQANPALLPYVTSNNLVENGGFELPLLNGGFEWKYATRPDATVSLDTARFHSGRQSLRLAFRAAELWDGPILQSVPVRPRTSYVFSALVSTEDLWTLSGPRLRIQDACSETRLALSDAFTGSVPWTRFEQVFTTGADTRLVTISLVRIPGGSSIHGSLWLDDVSLNEVRP